MNKYPHCGIWIQYHFSESRALRTIIAIALLVLTGACGRRLEGTVTLDNGNSKPVTPIDAAPIIEKYRALDSSLDKTISIRASVSGNQQAVEFNAARQIQFTMYRKHQPDGRLLILVEFNSPAEERDRDGLITVFPDGQIEGIRYVQSTNSFIVTRDLMSEDALFGLTLQELADGQPEKYDFTIAQGETFEGTACYRAEGNLKQGVESKFPRVVLLILKETFAVVRAEFYDNHDQLARDLTVSKTEQVAGRWTRMRWNIDNRARGKKIDFEALHVSYDQNLKDSMFTREHLKIVASR